jgi:hypothetical protein
MIRVHYGNKILAFPTCKWVETDSTNYKLFERQNSDTKKGEVWLASVPLSCIIESGNGPIDMLAQHGLFE